MEELLQQVQHILNTEEGQQQLKDMMGMLGGQNGEMPDLSSLFGGSSEPSDGAAAPPSDDNSPLFSPEMLFMLQHLMGSMKNEDDNTRLLLALKPHFREERRSKVDQAVQFLRLFALWPVLKESGLLGGLFNAK